MNRRVNIRALLGHLSQTHKKSNEKKNKIKSKSKYEKNTAE
jgi:hypothetical protein